MCHHSFSSSRFLTVPIKSYSEMWESMIGLRNVFKCPTIWVNMLYGILGDTFYSLLIKSYYVRFGWVVVTFLVAVTKYLSRSNQEEVCISAYSTLGRERHGRQSRRQVVTWCTSSVRK